MVFSKRGLADTWSGECDARGITIQRFHAGAHNAFWFQSAGRSATKKLAAAVIVSACSGQPQWKSRLSVLAYNLGNLWRRLVLPKRIDTWSLTSLQQRLVKTGGRLVKHPRYYWLLLAEGHLTRRLFGATLQRIWALPVPAG